MSDASDATEDKREQIYQAALSEFLENGFRGASMDRISQSAGASKRTVYKYFESKENLFQEMVLRHQAQFSDSLNVSYQAGQDIEEQLIALGRAEGRLFTSPDVMAMSRMLMSEILRSPELVEKCEQSVDYRSSFERMLHDATQDGQLDVEDVGRAAEEFVTLLKGKAFWPVLYGAPLVTSEEMDAIVANSVAMIMSRYGV